MYRQRNAFTLVELLIVIAIIGLLVGILVPSLSQAQTLARRAGCRTNLHAVGVGMRMYLNDSEDVMPTVASMPSLNLNTDPRLVDVLKPYAPQEAFRCPADTVKNYWQSEGSSFQYSTMLAGRKMGDSFMTGHWGEARTTVMYDYEPFHGPAGTSGSCNYLFADMHVGDVE